MKRIILVAKPDTNARGNTDYVRLAESYALHLEHSFSAGKGPTKHSIEVLRTHKMVTLGLKVGDTIVFISRSWLEIARSIKRERPELHIVVVTSSPPKDEVHLVNAFWLDSSAEISRHLLPRGS